MKKNWGRGVALTLALSVVMSSMPYENWNVIAKQLQTGSTQSTITSNNKINNNLNGITTKKTADTETLDYKDGEVVVMYRNTSKTVKASALKSYFGEDIIIGSTCEFYENTDKDNKVQTKNLSNNKLSVSLVRSDVYNTKQLISQLLKRKDVLYAEPNYICKATGTGDYSKYLWGLNNRGQNGGTEGLDIQADSQEGVQFDDKEKVIAVLDTGVDYTHEDLANVMWNNPYEEDLKGKHGYDFVSYDEDPMDDNGHGTHCAGVAAADSTNDIGVKGAVKGNVKIMALKFLDSTGYGDMYSAISAYNYIYRAQQLGTNIVAVNNSWGGEMDEYAEIFTKIIDMVGEQGAVSVCAASNEGTDNDKTGVMPANLESDYIISVTAATEEGDLAAFSNYGLETVDMAAPGTNILSTVPYDIFNPSIYNNPMDFCTYYEDFSNEFNGTQEQLGEVHYVNTNQEEDKFSFAMIQDGDGEVSVQKDTKVYFGEKTEQAGALNWSIANAKAGEKYYLYIPYDAKETDKTMFQSFMLRESAPKLDEATANMSMLSVYDMEVASGGAIAPDKLIEQYDDYVGEIGVYDAENYWSHIYYEAQDKIKKSQKRAIVLMLNIVVDGDYTLYLDDLGVSKENLSSNKFGKYEFYSGSSMATPYVSAAIAQAKGFYPTDTVLETCMRVLGSTTYCEKLKGKVNTNGILDLSKLKEPNPVVLDGSISSDGTVTLNGLYLGNGMALSVNGATTPILSQTEKQITFAGAYDTKLQVSVQKGEYSSKKELFFVSGSEMERKGVTYNEWEDGDVVSDGDKLYFVSEYGNIICYDVDNDTNYTAPEKNGFEATAKLSVLENNSYATEFDMYELFGEDSKTILFADQYAVTNPISHGKELYTVVRLDLGYAEDNVLARFNIKEMKWEKVADVPKEFKNTALTTLASYGDKIYVLGGYKKEDEKSISTVYSYHVASNVWKKEADMPGARFGAKAVQSQSYLVITLGGNDQGGCTENYIFDGNQWLVGGKMQQALDEQTYTYELPYKEGMVSNDTLEVDRVWGIAYKKLKYYDGITGAIDGGVMYSGIRVPGLGNTFTYDLATAEYKTAQIKLTTMNEEDSVFGGTIGNKFYTLSGSTWLNYSTEEYIIWSIRKKLAAKQKQEVCTDDYGFGDEKDALLFISNTKVTHKNRIYIKQEKNYDGGYINGVGNYGLGEMIKLSAIPNEDYFVKNLYVNGKSVENGYCAMASKEYDNAKISADFGAYVSYMEMKERDTVAVGSSKKLTLSIFPEIAENKNIIWSSSDEDVIKVAEDGTITGQKGAVGKTAVIKAVAADRGTVLETCSVEVVKKEAVKNVKTKKITLKVAKKNIKAGKSVKVKAGKSIKIKAVVKPKNATNKKIKWKSAKKKYATVNNKGKVKTKKAGKGHTVKITAVSVSNPKIKASVKIKIK